MIWMHLVISQVPLFARMSLVSPGTKIILFHYKKEDVILLNYIL